MTNVVELKTSTRDTDMPDDIWAKVGKHIPYMKMRSDINPRDIVDAMLYFTKHRPTAKKYDHPVPLGIMRGYHYRWHKSGLLKGIEKYLTHIEHDIGYYRAKGPNRTVKRIAFAHQEVEQSDLVTSLRWALSALASTGDMNLILSEDYAKAILLVSNREK